MNDNVNSKAKKRPSPLKNWKAYKSFYDSQKDKKHLKIENARLNRFEARFSLASNFQGIKADGITTKTLRGYDAGMRLLLAYTAAELLCNVIGGSINEWKIEDETLAIELRDLLNNYNRKVEMDDIKRKDISIILDKNTPIGIFNAFIESEHSDIRIVATAIRVGMAHGPFSPHAFDVNSAKDAATINQLSKRLLQKCQQEFNEWFKKLKAAYKC